MQQHLSVRRSATDAPLYYVVTAVNRYGIESTSTNTKRLASATYQPASQSELIPNDGYSLQVPDFEKLPQASCFVVYTMPGNMIAQKPLGPVVSVSDLPKGVYELRTLNDKGDTHHVGYFLKK